MLKKYSFLFLIPDNFLTFAAPISSLMNLYRKMRLQIWEFRQMPER